MSDRTDQHVGRGFGQGARRDTWGLRLAFTFTLALGRTLALAFVRGCALDWGRASYTNRAGAKAGLAVEGQTHIKKLINAVRTAVCSAGGSTWVDGRWRL